MENIIVNIIETFNDHCVVVDKIQNNYNIIQPHEYSSRKEEDRHEANKDKCIGEVLTQLYAEHYIKWKKDWAVIHRICRERGIYDNLHYVSLVYILEHYAEVPHELLPTASSLSKVIFVNRYPNWEIDGQQPAENKRMTTIAQRFIELYGTV